MKKKLSFITFWLFFLLSNKTAWAICPVCTVAAGAGISLSRWLGIDDTITGLWIGGLIVSLTMWTINWLDKKGIKFKLRKISFTVLYYLMVLGPLYWKKLIGNPYHKLWGVDKLLLGTIIGSLAFYIMAKWYLQIKAKNQNHAQFPFQKIVMTLGSLLILSGIFYWITK